MKYIVCYDITDRKRLRDMAKYLRRYGKRIEKSVFECNLAKKDYDRLVHFLHRFVSGCDVVHIFGIAANLNYVKIEDHDCKNKKKNEKKRKKISDTTSFET